MDAKGSVVHQTAGSSLCDGVCVVGVGLGARRVQRWRILTVEFSVRLVSEGKSLLMVQVSVREPARGHTQPSPLSRLQYKSVISCNKIWTEKCSMQWDYLKMTFVCCFLNVHQRDYFFFCHCQIVRLSVDNVPIILKVTFGMPWLTLKNMKWPRVHLFLSTRPATENMTQP